MRRCGLMMAGCALLAAMAGCAVRVAPNVWATSEMVALTDRSRPTAGDGVFDGESGTVHLTAAANEVVGFQVVVDPPRQGLRRLQVLPGQLAVDPKLTLPADTVRLFRMLPVPVEEFPAWFLRLSAEPVAPGRYYDALVPLDAAGADQMSGNERVAIWVDVPVPRDAAPGRYKAPLTVRYAGGGRTLTIDLRVYDFVLPETRPVVCVGGFDHRAIYRQFVQRKDAEGRETPFVPYRMNPSDPNVRAGLVVLRDLMKLAHDHRLDLFDRALRPQLRRDRNANVVLDWEDYDAIVTPYLSGSAFADRIGVSVWPAPVSASWPDPADYGGPDSPAYLATVRAVAAGTVEHFRTLGAERKLFVWPQVAGSGPAAYARHMALAEAFGPPSDRPAVLSELPLQPPREGLWAVPAAFPSCVDMAAPPAPMADYARSADVGRISMPLSGMWLRPGSPPYVGDCGILAAPADVRCLPWMAVKYGCRGLFLPEVLHWEDDPFAPGEQARGCLFYPGQRFGIPSVLPSARLKRLRRGLQDVSYLWLLRRHQRGAIARAMTDTLVRYAGLDAAGDHFLDAQLDGWVRDGDAWILARRLLAEELLNVLRPTGTTQRELMAQRLDWQRLVGNTCRVRVERISTRVAAVAGTGLIATVRLEVFNEFSRPVDATASVAFLPTGWTCRTGEQTLPAIPAGGRGSMEFTLTGDRLPEGTDGKLKVPLTLRSSVGPPRRVSAEVPLLVAGLTDRTIRIDGDLGDWPLRPGNAAGRFRPVGRRQRVDDGLATRQTDVLALRGPDTLYLAFRCREPDVGQLRAQPTNMVNYQQLMVTGEDVVEVILDPTARASRLEELYHLIIKSNGVTIAERGLPSDPPVGESGPWPVTVKAAVGKGKDLWTAEVAIPLSALPDGAADGFWRVNFARFATAGAEASSWTGATRTVYDPQSLGTMFVPSGQGSIRNEATGTRQQGQGTGPPGESSRARKE